MAVVWSVRGGLLSSSEILMFDLGQLVWNPDKNFPVWQGVMALPGLSGCRIRWEEDGSPVAEPAPDDGGRTDLVLYARREDGMSAERGRLGPYPEQVAAIEYLLRNEAAISTMVIDTLAEFYVYNGADYFAEDGASEELVEHVKTHGGIQETLQLGSTYLHPGGRDGSAYVGISFGLSLIHI